MSSHSQLYKPKRSHSFIMRLTLLIIVLAFVAVIGLNIFKGMMISKAIANAGEQPSPVTAVKIETKQWTPVIETTGSVRPNQGSIYQFFNYLGFRFGNHCKRYFGSGVRLSRKYSRIS